MAMLMAAGNGDLTTAATWVLAEDGTGAQLTTLTASTTTTTSYVYSSTFTGTNTRVVDGIALFCKRVNTTGTVSVALSENNGTTATRSVTVNASDLPLEESWVFFKFGSTLTLDGGTDYRVGVLGSSAGNATFYRDATAGNWGRLVRRTAAPASVAAGDTFLISGEWTAASTVTTRTVTMNSTAATDYGTGTATATAPTQTTTQAFTGLQIGQSGTLTWGTTAATNYILRLSGNLVVWSGGTYNQGTTGTPCPRDSTMTLEFDCAADGDFGFLAMQGSTVNMQGQSRTSGKDIWWTLLNTDEAANSTSLGVADDTGWLDNDRIAVASTTRTRTECEAGTLNGGAGASTMTVDGFAGTGGGLAFAHSGTSPTQAEVILLTRNVKVRSTLSTAMTYCFFGTTATADLDWVEFRYLCPSAGTSNKQITILTTTGSFDMRYCAISDCEGIAIFISSSTANNITIRYNCFYNVGNANFNGFAINATSGTNWVISDNIMMLTGQLGFSVADVGGTFQNNRAIGAGSSGFSLAESGATLGTISGLIAHSNANSGITFTSAARGSVSDLTAWRNTSNGVDVATTTRYNLTINGVTAFGNAPNIAIAGDLTLINMTLNGDSSFATATGISINNNTITTVVGADMSTVSGIMTSHTSDVSVSSVEMSVAMTFQNCKFGASTEVATQSNLSDNSFIASMNHDQVAGAHRTYKRTGTITRDTTIYNTASPSERLTPNNASAKLASGSRLIGVDSGGTKTISVYVRKSVVGDGAAYNGNQPRLMMKRQDIMGYTSDTVLDTMTSAAGSWEQLSATTAAASQDGVFEVYVDCDGSAGFVNVDDWSVS
jgi:hypothetical protein